MNRIVDISKRWCVTLCMVGLLVMTLVASVFIFGLRNRLTSLQYEYDILMNSYKLLDSNFKMYEASVLIDVEKLADKLDHYDYVADTLVIQLDHISNLMKRILKELQIQEQLIQEQLIRMR